MQIDAGKTLVALVVLLLLAPSVTAVDSKDQRTWSRADFIAEEKQPGSILRSYRRQRNLMYALQRALNERGYKAGPRYRVWKPPFRKALARYQTDNALTGAGEVTPETVKNLLGVDLPGT